MNGNEVIKIIATALKLEDSQIDTNSSVDNLEEWDSLGHLGILAALDKAFDGKIASIKEMATADSVEKIFQILKENSFIES